MKYRDFILSQDGKCSYRIVLPCFEDPEHPGAADRMNRFYSAAADAAYRYAQTLLDGAERRSGYFCTCQVTESEDGVEVLLRFSFRRTGQKTLRRELRHLWRDGILIPAKKSGGSPGKG